MAEILTGRVIKGHLLIRGSSITQSGKVKAAEAQEHVRGKTNLKLVPGILVTS